MLYLSQIDCFLNSLFEVYREALIGEKSYISLDDFDHFFAVKKENDPIVAKWGTYTTSQLAKGYRTILVDSGIGETRKKKY